MDTVSQDSGPKPEVEHDDGDDNGDHHHHHHHGDFLRI
jgi:hypothetical protein